jgi:hypothetical protein
MITSHISPFSVPAQITLDRTTFHRRCYVAVSLQNCNGECGVRISGEGTAFSVSPKKCLLNSCIRLGLPPHKFFIFHSPVIHSKTYTVNENTSSPGLAAYFSFTTFPQFSLRAYDVTICFRDVVDYHTQQILLLF